MKETECFVKDSFLILKTSTAFRRIRLSEILYFFVRENYTFLLLFSQKEELIPDSLSNLMIILPTAYFFQINKSVIVNMQHCEKCEFTSRLSNVWMSNGTQFVVSRRRARLFQKGYDLFLKGDNPFKDIF